MGDFENRGSNLEKKGWKRCQREGTIGRDWRLGGVVVTVDILLSGGGGNNEKGRR